MKATKTSQGIRLTEKHLSTLIRFDVSNRVQAGIPRILMKEKAPRLKRKQKRIKMIYVYVQYA